MKTRDDIRAQQHSSIAELRQKAGEFIRDTCTKDIETVLLSGSVARGDYFPGRFGGMTDLTVLKKNGSTRSAEDIFGKNQDPAIPYHCVQNGGVWYEIDYREFLTAAEFARLPEPRKFSILESEIVYDPLGTYEAEHSRIAQLARQEQQTLLREGLGYIDYLLSDYKKDRWYRRDAYIQLHENLNTAVRTAVRCLFYINGQYSPAEDRALYYSHSLQNVPPRYAECIAHCCDQVTDSEADYLRRERAFTDGIVSYIKPFAA